MKKLLIVLMVLAMSSFLFVGCLPTAPEVPTEPTEPTEPTVEATATPVITAVTGVNLTSTATQYVNTAEAGTSIVGGIDVTGTAPTYAEVKIYIGSKVAGTADVAANGRFICAVTLTELGVDGEKTVYVVATEPGLAESAKSNEVKFTLDTVAPTMASVVGRIAADYYEVTFSEAVGASADYTVATGTPSSALNFANWDVNGTTLLATDVITAVSTKVIKFGLIAGTSLANSPAVWTGTAQLYSFECDLVVDVAGNPISATSIIYGTLLP